jgi:tetratricopeptide (TPR) repeat protein
MNKGLCLTQLGRVEQAIPEFTAAARSRPEDYRPRYRRALIEMQLHRYAEAADDLTAVIAHFPEDAELYEKRADCYAAISEKTREAADRAAAAKFLPHSVQGLNYRAWKLTTGPRGERDPEMALKLIRKALEIAGDDQQCINTLGVALYRNSRWTEAIAALEKSLTLGQGRYDAYNLFFLAMCHAQLGDMAKAKGHYNRAVKWIEGQKSLPGQAIEELKAFRAEAEEVLRSP